MIENSVITKTRRTKLCRASSGAEAVLAPITHIAFGDGGVQNGEPLPPGESQTELGHEIARYPVGAVTYPVDTTATYTVTIPKDELVGQSISEAALVDSQGDLAAIKTMYPKRKDEGTAFTFAFDDEY